MRQPLREIFREHRLDTAASGSRRFFTLLKNLLENAIQHSRAGDVVQIRVAPNLISVQDEGSGVTPEP